MTLTLILTPLTLTLTLTLTFLRGTPPVSTWPPISCIAHLVRVRVRDRVKTWARHPRPRDRVAHVLSRVTSSPAARGRCRSAWLTSHTRMSPLLGLGLGLGLGAGLGVGQGLGLGLGIG